MVRTPSLGALLVACALAAGWLGPARAVVLGEPPTLWKQHAVYGRAVGVGNTLMATAPQNPLVNAQLLPSSSAVVTAAAIPEDATIAGAYLFWSGSKDGPPDSSATLQLPSGGAIGVQADDCRQRGTPQLGSFYYCRADVTAALQDAPQLTGAWSVSGVDAQPGAIDPFNPKQCAPNSNGCQAKYAGWSLVLVWEAPSEPMLRDVLLYDAFMMLDETPESAGIATFTIDGFNVGDPAQATFTTFALEGDFALGVPPQDTDPDPSVQCSHCWDFLRFNGTELADEKGWPKNFFNSSNGLGVDIDTVDVSHLVKPGQTQATIQVGSGDDVVSFQPASHGHGEVFFFGYSVLSISRLAPSFKGPKSVLTADREEVAKGEHVKFTLDLVNEGSIHSLNLVARIESFPPPGTEVVPGTMFLGDTPITAQQLASGVNIGLVQPNQARSVTFTLRVLPTTQLDQIQALARLTYGYPGAAKPIAHPVGPAVVKLTDAPPPPAVRVEKRVADPNGGAVAPGDTLVYTVDLHVDGPTLPGPLRLEDPLPPTVDLAGVEAPPGAKTTVAPPSPGQGPRVVVEGLTATPDAPATVVIRATVKSGLSDGTAVCNTAQLALSGRPPLLSEPACVTVGVSAVTQRLVVQLYEDRDGDGAFTRSADFALPGFRVRLYPAPADGDAGPLPGAPVAAAIAGPDGAAVLPDLPLDRYQLVVLSDTGAQFHREIREVTANTNRFELAVTPSGRVWRTDDRTLVTGLPVRALYADDDPLAPGQPVPAELLGLGQQDQALGRHGLYRFDLPPERRYRLEVVTQGSDLLFPSRRFPPQVGPGVTGPTGAVTAQADPLAAATAPPWFLLWAPAPGAAAFSHNHLALDPAVAQVSLTLTALDRTLRRGEAATFTLELRNEGTLDFTPGAEGALALEVRLPEGLRYVSGSARLRNAAGTLVPLREPDDRRTLLLGVSDEDGALAGLELLAGARQLVTLQAVAAPSAAVDAEHTVRALALRMGGEALTPQSAAVVRLEREAEFDESLVMGQVFCDADGDGEQDPGEGGLGGVRVYADHGWFSDTDRAGQFHLKKLEPGQHLFKVDEATLPPGAKPTTPVRRLVYFTPGLVLQVRFGVTCPHEVVSAGRAEAPAQAGQAPPGEVALAPLPVVTVAGDTRTLALSLDGRTLPDLAADLTVRLPGAAPTRAVNVPWAPLALEAPLTFQPRVTLPDATGATWRLEVVRVGDGNDQLVRELFGQGAPPDEIVWRGLDPAGTASVLERGALHRVRLHVAHPAAGLAVSPDVVLGVSWGAAGAPLYEETVRGQLFDAGMAPRGPLISRLNRVRPVLAANPGARLVVEVHSDDSGTPELDMTATRRGAMAVADVLAKRLRLEPRRFTVVGRGSTVPLRLGFDERSRQFNRRVEIRVLPAVDAASLASPPAAEARAAAFVQGLAADGADAGPFARSVDRPRNGKLAVRVVAPSGATRVVVADVPAAGGPAKMEPAEQRALAADPLRRFGGDALARALGEQAVVAPSGVAPGGKPVTADQLKVKLPPRGLPLGTNRLFLAGETHPDNRVTVNGVAVGVDDQGRFSTTAPLPTGKSELVIVSTDAAGYTARVTWPVEVTDREFFLLALADGAVGQVGARLAERTEATSTETDGVFLQGRGALYLKGRVSGSALAEELFVTAHLDTARRRGFTPFYEQVIDPARDYAVFGDASADIQDAQARGPLYVLVEADRSRLKVGNFRTDLQGIELLRYQRTFYGVEVDLNHAVAEGFDTRLQGFATDDNDTLVRGQDELRATGGSLYYLSHRELIEGSDKIEIVVREQLTGMELARVTLLRDRDYRVDYRDGRVTMKAPLASTVDALFTIGDLQPFGGREILDGHEVWVVATYEARDGGVAGQYAYGVHGAQRLGKHLEIGGGYVREQRRAGEDYELLGAHAKVDVTEDTRLTLEFAESLSSDGATRVSNDGGLNYRQLDRSGGERHGFGFKAGLDSHVGKLVGEEALDLRVTGWYQSMDPGFHAWGHTLQRGMEKVGGQALFRPTEHDQVLLRADLDTVLLTERETDRDRFDALTRLRYSGQYRRRIGRLGLLAEGAWAQHRDDGDGVVHDTAAVALGGSWAFTDRLTGTLSQEAVLAGDDAVVGSSLGDRMTTNVGLIYKLTDDFALSVGEILRWNGDNATRVGVRTRLVDSANVYLEERFQTQRETGDLVHATVVGADTNLDEAGLGRAWGEYRLDTGVAARTNRAVLGLSRRFPLAEGVSLSGAYEHTQTFGGYEGRGGRDVVSAGLEVLAWDRLKLGGRYEVRWDRGDQVQDGSERIQALLMNGLDFKLTEDLTFLGVGNYTLTQNLTNRSVEEEALEATAGLAYRPVEADWLTLVARATRHLRHRDLVLVGPDGAPLGLTQRQLSSLFSVAAIFELPWRFQLAEKVAWKHVTTRLSGSPEATDDLVLWVNRLGYHLVDGFDAAVEYRLLHSALAGGTQHGALVELAYTIARHVRLGAGYNFTDFSDDLLDDPDRDHGGFYLRMTGMY